MNRSNLPAVLVTALAASLGVPASSARAQGGPPPATVRVDTVETRTVGELRLVTGQIEAAKRSTVAAEEAGRVVVSPPPPGTVLKEGDLITRVDDALLKIDLESAKAAVVEAEAAVTESRALVEVADRDVKRLEALLGSNVAKQKEVDDARDQLAVRRARLALAQAIVTRGKSSIMRLEERIANTVIRAPLDGSIVMKHAELGEWLGEGDPVVEFIATDRLRIRLNIPELMVAGIDTETDVTVHVNATDRDYTLKPYAIVPDADVQARTFSLLLYLDNADGKAKSGMSVSSQLPTGKQITAMTVPRDALLTTPTGTQVFAARGGVAVPVPVRIRFASGDRFVVEGNLKDGDPVITDGNERLFPGQPLKILNGKPAPPPSTASEE